MKRRTSIVLFVLAATLFGIGMRACRDGGTNEVDRSLHEERLPDDTRTRGPRASSDTEPGDASQLVARDAADGTVVSGVTVELHLRRSPRAPRTTRTDEAGRVELSSLTAGRWLAIAKRRGFTTSMLEFECGPECTVAHVLEMHRSPTLRGTVRSSDGSPASSTHLQLRQRSALEEHLSSPETLSRVSMGSLGTAVTDERGRFEFDSLPADVPLVVQCRHETAGVGDVHVSALAPGESRDVEIALEPMSGLRGRIARELLLGGKAAIDVFRMTGGDHLVQEGRALVAPPNAEFEFVPLLAGEKLIAAQTRRGDEFDIQFVRATVHLAEVTDVGELRATSSLLRVGVSSSESSNVGRDADLLVQCVGQELIHQLLPIHIRAPIGRTIVLRGLPPGRIILSASMIELDGSGHDADEGHGQQTIQFDGVSGDASLVLSRPRGARARLIARFPPDTAVQRRRARWIVSRGSEVVTTSWRAPPGVDRYTTPMLEPGEYRIEVFGAGLRASRDLRIDDSDITATIDNWLPSTYVAGQVVDSTGSPADRATISMNVRGPDGVRHTVGETRSDAAGRFRIDATPADVTIELVANFGASTSGTLEVHSAGTADDLLLELRPSE